MVVSGSGEFNRPRVVRVEANDKSAQLRFALPVCSGPKLPTLSINQDASMPSFARQ
jgi:hypothetical protein